MAVRVPEHVIAGIDKYAKADGVKTRSEAIRMIVARSLPLLRPIRTKGAILGASMTTDGLYLPAVIRTFYRALETIERLKPEWQRKQHWLEAKEANRLGHETPAAAELAAIALERALDAEGWRE